MPQRALQDGACRAATTKRIARMGTAPHGRLLRPAHRGTCRRGLPVSPRGRPRRPPSTPTSGLRTMLCPHDKARGVRGLSTIGRSLIQRSLDKAQRYRSKGLIALSRVTRPCDDGQGYREKTTRGQDQGKWAQYRPQAGRRGARHHREPGLRGRGMSGWGPTWGMTDQGVASPGPGSMPSGTARAPGTSGGRPPSAIQWLSWKTQAITSATTV